jgi:hypothetical protein
MALLEGQLLFAERKDARTVRVDVIVLARLDAPESPAVGAPVCFEFALPGDAVWREAMSRLLRSWADELAVVELDVLERHGRTLVRVATGDTALTLEEPLPRPT